MAKKINGKNRETAKPNLNRYEPSKNRRFRTETETAGFRTETETVKQTHGSVSVPVPYFPKPEPTVPNRNRRFMNRGQV